MDLVKFRCMTILAIFEVTYLHYLMPLIPLLGKFFSLNSRSRPGCRGESERESIRGESGFSRELLSGQDIARLVVAKGIFRILSQKMDKTIIKIIPRFNGAKILSIILTQKLFMQKSLTLLYSEPI